MIKKLLLFLLPTYLFSCLWIDGTTIDGDFTNEGSYVKSLMINDSIEHHSPASKLEDILKYEKRDKLSRRELKEHDAVILLLKGEYDASIDAFLKLVEEYPNQYSLASNLGTAYELNAKNQDALKWIKKGIALNADSHYGSEWVHVLILETKIKLESNPDFLQEHQIISLPKKFNLTTQLEINDNNYTIQEIQRAIEYQLRERTVFVKPQDAVVAVLLFTLARISAQISIVEEGIKYLDMAQLYGFKNVKLWEETKRSYMDIIENTSLFYKIEKWFTFDIVIMSIFISFFLIVYILLKRGIVKIYRKFKK